MKGELVETLTFSGSAGVVADDGETETSPVVILTVILAVIFIVLLIVLIVLIGKKPEKSGEFGESYY
jgi:preprotein translocase subunit SecG